MAPVERESLTNLLIKDDTILQVGFTPYTPRDIETRLALLVITQSAPWLASLLILLIQKQWWLKKYYWTYARMASFWFLSVAIVGLGSLHIQAGKTTRVTFIVAAIHMQVEVLITCLFLKRTGFQAIAISAVWALFVYGSALFLDDLGTVFMVIAPLGGANDFLMALLLIYAKQWLYAIGALAHVVAALTVFASISVDIGVVNQSKLTFIALFVNLTFYVGAIFRAYAHRNNAQPPRPELLAEKEPDRLQTNDKEDDRAAFDNPLLQVKLSSDTFIKLASLSFAGATIISYFLACGLVEMIVLWLCSLCGGICSLSLMIMKCTRLMQLALVSILRFFQYPAMPKTKRKSAAAGAAPVPTTAEKEEQQQVENTPEQSTSAVDAIQPAEIDWDATETVKVNKSSLSELRIAAEDFLKDYFSRPSAYKESHRHEDIHLLLGWSAAIIMGATALYAWYVPFVECKSTVVAGTAASVFFLGLQSLIFRTCTLNGLLWLYLTFVKKDVVFSGRRKTFSGRIETENLIVRAKTLPKPPENPPLLLVLKYSRSVNSGKTVINGPTERVQSVSFGEIFDSEGVMHKSTFAKILGELESDVTAMSLTGDSERLKAQ